MEERSNLLKALRDRVGFECYSDGFGLSDYADAAALMAGWSKDPDFNGSGSDYALWRVDDRTDHATLPLVVFGDEGGQFVVARHIRQPLQLRCYDTEISAWPDQAYCYRDEDHHKPGPGHEEYVDWLGQHFAPTPAADPNAVIATAQAEFGERFDAWVTTFLPS
jgi:hypothetical protein